MGTRYFITVICPKCETVQHDVYYAPTCDFNTWMCDCGCVVDLEEYTGISEKEASNRPLIEAIVDMYKKLV